MKKTIRFGMAALAVAVLSCNQTLKFPVLTGQVSRMMDLNLTTATVLVGTMHVNPNAFIATPDPWDTSFSSADFPLWLTPISGQAAINATTVPERVSGIYFSVMNGLPYLSPCDLTVTPSDLTIPEITAHAIMPDSFSITSPAPLDSLGHDSLRVCWTRSDSAELYTINLTPADSASTARGFLLSLTDTTVTVPATAFEDSLSGSFRPGNYDIVVWSLNGGWKQGGVFRLGGGVHGAAGIFGCAIYPRPVTVRLR